MIVSELRLTYSEAARPCADAWLIRGRDVRRWVDRLTTFWETLETLALYAIATPSSDNAGPTQPTALFVCAPCRSQPCPPDMAPYTRVQGELYIPGNAELLPALTDADVREAIRYEVAVFHPSAGLIGFLWLFERRSSAARERQLDEAHRKVMTLDRQVETLLTVVKDNTRAINSLELSQRRLIELLDHLGLRRTPGAAPGCS